MPCHWPSQICLLLTPRRGLHRTLTWRQAWHSTFMYHGKRRQKGEITSSWELKNKQQTRNAGTACWASLEGWPRHSRCYKDVLLEPRLHIYRHIYQQQFTYVNTTISTQGQKPVLYFSPLHNKFSFAISKCTERELNTYTHTDMHCFPESKQSED